MCGRYVSSSTADEIAKYFGVDAIGDAELEPNYNVAPTAGVYAIAERAEARTLDAYRWGLVPHWAKDPGIGNKMINARAETIATKNSYRSAFKRKRCIIPVNGFYEWTKVEGEDRKQPLYIYRADGDMMGFAGLYETWQARDADGEYFGDVLNSTTIITGEPNKKMAEVHHRMPVILAPSDWGRWLDSTNDDTDSLQKLLVPAPDDLIDMHPVSTEVNNARNKGAHLIDAL
jgi:putative SOS response-associated peptidase YedK